MAVTQAQVAQLYVALFNRAPEGDGFRAWVAAGATKTQAQIANEMLASPATAPYYASLGIDISTNRGYVELIYKNILGKDYVRDPEGINAWVRHLDAGHSRGDTLVKLFEVATSAEARAADPVAAAVFANKTEIASYMAQKIADIRQDLSGDYDYREFQEIIKTTTATNLDEQRARVDALAASTVHNLNSDSNEILGGVGQDIFNAVSDSIASNATLNPTDKIDGGGGENTLNVRVNDSFSGMTTGYIKHIDNLNLTSTASSAKTFNARGIEGLRKVTLDSQKGLNLLNPQNIVDISLQNVTSNAADGFKLDYNSSTIAGVDDTQNLTLDKVNLHKNAISGVVGNDNAGINIPNIENLNITTKGEKSNVTIKSGGTAGNHYKNITVKGNTDLTVKAESDRIEKFDASAFTATLDYTYKALAATPAGATSIIKGGSSKDVINLDFTDVRAADARPYFEIDGGAGNDEVNVRVLKADENRFNITNVEKVNIHKVEGAANTGKNHSIDFTGSDVTHLYTTKFEENLKVVNSAIKSVTVDKPALDESGNPIIGDASAAHPVGTTQFTNGYLENINIENTVDPRNPVGEAIIDPTVPGLRSKVTAYVSADESEKVTVNIGKNVYAQKIAGDWVDANKMHAAEGIGIIAPRAKDLTVNFNSPGTLGNDRANTTGISLTNIPLHNLATGSSQEQRSFDKLTINSKSNILSNVDATFLEKLKVFNINTDTYFEAIGTRQFNDIQQINANGLADNRIKTGKVYFTNNTIGKANSGETAAEATQGIAITAKNLASFKANNGIFTKGSIDVSLDNMQDRVEMSNGIDVPTNDTMKTHYIDYDTVQVNNKINMEYSGSNAKNSIITDATFKLHGNDITNLLVGNIVARDIDINPGNARGIVNLASGGGQYTYVAGANEIYANAVGKIGNDKTINNTVDLSQIAGTYYVGELFGQNIKFKAGVFNSPTYFSDAIDGAGTPSALETDNSNLYKLATTNTIKANFGGQRSGQNTASLDVKGVQTGTDKTNVYVKFNDGSNSPQDLKTFSVKGEDINLVVDGKFNTATTSKLETLDLSDVNSNSTTFVNLSAKAFTTNVVPVGESSTNLNYRNYHNERDFEHNKFGFGKDFGHGSLKNPLFNIKGASAADTFVATSTLPEWGARTAVGANDGVTGSDVPTFNGVKYIGGENSTNMVRTKSEMGAAQHTKLSLIKGSKGNDVVLLGDDMATGVTATPDGIKRLNVELGDGDDIIHTGKLADNTEIVIDGGRGRDVFDVSRSKTNANLNKIVTIKNIEAGDKIKLADYFAHAYDPKDPSGDTFNTNWTDPISGYDGRNGGTEVRAYKDGHPNAITTDGDGATHGRYFDTSWQENKKAYDIAHTTPAYNREVDIGSGTVNGTNDNNTAVTPSTLSDYTKGSSVSGYHPAKNTSSTSFNSGSDKAKTAVEKGVVSQTGTDGHVGGDRYEYTANYGDAAWEKQQGNGLRDQTPGSNTNISVGGKNADGQYNTNVFYGSNGVKPFYELGSAPVTANAANSTVDGGVAVPSQFHATNSSVPPVSPPGVNYQIYSAIKTDGTTQYYYYDANSYTPPSLGGTNKYLSGGYLYGDDKVKLVNGALWSKTYVDVHGKAGTAGATLTNGNPVEKNVNGTTKVVIENSGVKGQITGPAASMTQTNLRKAIVVDTATDSQKHAAGVGSNIAHNDQMFYDAHNILKLTVRTKLTDLSTVAGLDTLKQAVDHAISGNRMWADTTTVNRVDSYFSARYYSDENGAAVNSSNVVKGWVRDINRDPGDNGSYEAHNDRLYAFSWRGDTYLVYDKKAVAAGATNSIGAEDTIVRLAGVNLDSLKYTVDPKTGTITIDDVQFGG